MLDENDDHAWRSRQIRLLYRMAKFNLAFSLFSLAFALWVNYRA